MVKDLRQFLGQLFTDLQKLLEVLAPLVANPNTACDDGVTPILGAAQNGFAEIVEILASLVANPNSCVGDGFTPFGMAAHLGHLNVVKILAHFIDDFNASQLPRQGMHREDEGMSAIGIAAANGHLEVIRFLSQFVDPTALDINGRHPIFIAIMVGQPEAVKLLAYLSKNLPTPLMDGTTPIQLAEIFGANEIVAILKTVEKAH